MCDSSNAMLSFLPYSMHLLKIILLHQSAVMSHLESLAHVKVFWWMDSSSYLMFLRGDRHGNFYTAILLIPLLPLLRVHF